jgi:hypothetical protein
MIDRRMFLQLSSVFAFAPAGQSATAETGFAGMLTRTVFLDDVASLAARSMGINGGLARAINDHRALFLAGAEIEAGKDAAGAGLAPAPAIAASRVARQAYGPLAATGARDAVARDARMLRELGARSGNGSAQVSEREIADLFETLTRRVYIGIHTYIPDDKDVEGWMERLIRLHDAAHSYWRELARAYVASRPANDAFYDSTDSIIQAAMHAEQGKVDRAETEAALTAQPKSAYGRALMDAHRRLIALT